jgi:hypothetical protein
VGWDGRSADARRRTRAQSMLEASASIAGGDLAPGSCRIQAARC